MLQINKYGLFIVNKVLIDEVISEVECYRHNEVRICNLNKIYKVTIDPIWIWNKKKYENEVIN